MTDITGSEEVKVRYVRFQTGYSYSSGGYNFSIKLTPHPSNGKSCQVIIGDSGPNTYTTKNAPASCGDLQLTTNSQIGVSKGPLFKFTLKHLSRALKKIWLKISTIFYLYSSANFELDGCSVSHQWVSTYTNSFVNADSFYTILTNKTFQKNPIPHLTPNMKQKFLH